ncbi:MAG: UvrB/UvrC motif-containing protein [Candidatus Latescibacterota bacterium]
MSDLCKVCGVRPAQIHYTEIINKKVVTVDLCAECAKEKGIDIKKSGSYGVGDLVAGMIGSSAQTDSEKIGKVHCDFCGYDYSDFKKIGRFGCPECYRAFAEQLLPLLRHVHGSTQHRGKAPVELGPQAVISRELVELKEQLNRAIETEEYEKAAEIRDRIKDLETDTKE